MWRGDQEDGTSPQLPGEGCMETAGHIISHLHTTQCCRDKFEVSVAETAEASFSQKDSTRSSEDLSQGEPTKNTGAATEILKFIGIYKRSQKSQNNLKNKIKLGDFHFFISNFILKLLPQDKNIDL